MVKLFLVAALAALPAVAAQADPVPAATARVSTFYEPYSGTTKSLTVRSTGALTNGSVHADAEQGSTPFVSTSMTEGDNDFIDSGSATLTYSFLLTGSGTDVIPLHAYVKAFTQTTSSDYDVAANVGFSNATSSNGIGLRGNATFDGVLDFTAHAGDLTTVTLTVSGNLVCCDDAVGSSVSAYADPFFYIDADYLAAHPDMHFGLQFSNGVGNVDPNAIAAVPETASWAMMVIGFGAVGAAFRRRKASVSFA